MVGITSYGVYIPYYRLSRDEIARVWGGPSGRGEKAVANWDEDSITMAVAAALDSINSIDRQQIDGCFFASTTSPYREKQAAALVATVVDLRRDIITADSANSLRAGTIALRHALDAIKAGTAKNILVTTADCRLATPQSPLEPNFGDGAASFLIGDSEVAVAVEGSYQVSDEFTDMWRREQDTFVKIWEDRFSLEEGYNRIMAETISGLMKKYNLTPKDFAKVVLYAPDQRSHTVLARRLGFDLKEQLQDPLFTTVGNTGTACAMIGLAAALDEAKPGDRILLANYGDGGDALILQVTEQINKIRNKKNVKHYLESKKMLPNYQRYIYFRRIMPVEEATRPEEIASATHMWRDTSWVLRFHGGRCRQCGKVQIPSGRVCINCQTVDQFDEVRLSDEIGEVFSYNKDHVTTVPDPPNINAVVDFKEGARIVLRVTDRDPDEVRIGMSVEMTFRRIHEAGGFHNYFWKCRPIR